MYVSLSVCLYVRVCVCLSATMVGVNMCECPRWTEEGVRSFGAEVIGGYEPSDKGAGNQPPVLHMSSKHS